MTSTDQHYELRRRQHRLVDILRLYGFEVPHHVYHKELCFGSNRKEAIYEIRHRKVAPFGNKLSDTAWKAGQKR